MIVEQIELKEAYNELKTFLAEVHKSVHTEIEDPPEGSKALDHFKQKRVEYKKYLLTMNNLVKTLKSSSESLEKSVTEIIKISPDSYVDIQKQANDFLKECPYPKLVSEVTHLQCALKLLCDERNNKIEEIKNILYKQSKHVSSAIQADQYDGQEMKMKYLTSDDESDYIKSQSNIEAVNESKLLTTDLSPKSIDHRDQDVPLKNYENNQEMSGLRSSDHLIQLVTTIIKNNNEQNKTRFPELKILTYNGDRGEYDEFWAVFNQMMQENNNIWTVKQMLDNIDKLITSTEMYEEDEMRSYATESRQSGRSNCTNNVTVRNNIPQEILCRFCQQQGHRHAECNIHRTPSERRNSLRNRTICWKCLSVTHTSRQCTRENCSQCGQNHHRLLCLGRAPIAPYPNETLTNTWNQAQHTNEEKQISASQNSSIANNSLNHVNASENNSLRQNILMTADAEIWNHNTNQFERLIILFNSGSHLSFIPESHAKHLKLATS
uniref:DUF1758 domain-containing protein n=1 Tax=Heterorhabditis bacteriophora TaxID=37862 RepID=A0A1I7WLI9_HETBA